MRTWRQAALLLITAAGSILAGAGAGALSGCAGESSPAQQANSWRPAPKTIDGLTVVASVKGERLVLLTAGGPRRFIPGVNIGSTVPGRQPGELAVTAADYRRWLRQIGRLGLRAIRVYTILPPHFYQELGRHNRSNPDAPIYLVQGVWIPEEEFLATQDLFDDAVRRGFRRELRDASRAVHGELSRARSRGLAWGTWTADVSPWLLAYSIGVEWDPVATSVSDETNAGRTPYGGRFFAASLQASPTETWLAEMLDTVAAAEARHGLSIPLTFTNWPTTDPLSHPDEPLDKEDLVGIDANHIRATPAWPGGFFASYHAYPYYPDFQRYEKALRDYRLDGRRDPYAGYIAALRRHHRGMPLMITEFGVPSSIGLAHYGPLGRDQGGHSEQEMMRVDARLLRILHEQGCSGGFVFEWADEWFKFTWNTIDHQVPAERRCLWHDPLTNEQYFGLVATDPGRRTVAVIDGDGGEWDRNGSQVIHESRSAVREVRAVKDESYLYLRIVLGDRTSWHSRPVTIGIDVLPRGNRGLPGLRGRDERADYAFVLGPGRRGRAYVAAWNDPFTVVYGKALGFVPWDAKAVRPGSGAWVPQRLITNRPHVLPRSGRRTPVEWQDVGVLRFGTSDPASKRFDSRVIWAAGDVVEVRLPWAMAGFSDPSSRLALSVAQDGTLSALPVDRVGISVAVDDYLAVTNGYSWEPWQHVTWHERPKAGLATFAAAVRDVQQ